MQQLPGHDDPSFPRLARPDLNSIRRTGNGIVLVDHYERGGERPSILHAAGCKWLGAVGSYTVLRHGTDERDALRWLLRNRGDEGVTWSRCRNCGGRDASTKNTPLPRYAEGDAIVYRRDDRGAGRIHAITNDGYEVDIFRGPGTPDGRIRLPFGAATALNLVPGDIVWTQDAGGWTRGRVTGATSDEVTAVTSHRVHRTMPKAAISVREFESLADPVAALTSGYAGDRAAVEARRAFLTSYYAIAAEYGGMSGVLSAGVSLFPHQLAAVRRVLDDPIQRYLLADEVGLGKTIEAGLLIRQRVVDAPRSNILVLAPSTLIPQWEDELSERLGLTRFRAHGIEVAPQEDPRSWRRLQVPDLVVIDEAQRVASGWESPVKEASERFELAQKLTSEAARVLLLSATPMLHRERDLLAMLHLLDPDNFPLDDPEGFAERIQQREEIGRLFLSIAPDTPAFLLGDSLEEIRERFHDDALLTQLVDAVDLDGDAAARESALGAIRSHLSDTYRLHARIIRNRRAGIAGRSYAVRGRTRGSWLPEREERRDLIERALEDLRAALVTAVNDLGAEWVGPYADVFWSFVQASTGDITCLRRLADYCLTRRLSHLSRSGVDRAARGALRSIEATPEIKHALEQISALGDDWDTSGLESLADAVAEACHGATVVFTSATESATDLATLLADRQHGRVAALTAEMTSQERRLAIDSFLSGATLTLVCDAACEEGLNLQNAETVVHVDVPRSTSRIEQRIGRADRHGGRSQPVRCTVLTPTAEGFATAWIQLLDEVFDVYRTSTASTMFAIESVELEQQRAWFLDGLPTDVDQRFAALRDRVAGEQRRIDRLDAFDLLAHSDDREEDVVDRIVAVEQDQQHALFDSLFELAEVVAPALDLSVTTDDGTSLQASVGRTTTATAHRSALAAGDRGLWSACRDADQQLSLASLLRPGDPLVELIREQADWDESCQVYVARTEAGEALETVALRADLVVQCDPRSALETWQAAERARSRGRRATRTEADAPLALAALQRRIDAFFPPRIVTIWFGEDGQPVDDESLVADLEATIARDGARLDWAPDALEDVGRVLGARNGAAFLRDIGARAPVEAVSRTLDTTQSEATEAAERAWNDRIVRLRHRARHGDEGAARDAETEEVMSQHLLAALRAPVARWSSVALLVVSR